VPSSTADAVAREAAWLNTTGDGLPPLPAEAGGKWDLVQAYWPRIRATEKRSIYVTRTRLYQPRFANQRVMSGYAFRLRLWWPVLSSDGSAEAEQASLDVACDDLLVRITGPMLDKTHGGRFLSVAENPRDVSIEFADPEHTLVEFGALLADCIYAADDRELNA
jgi:hypothetical protein